MSDLLNLNPADLLVDTNIRTDLNLDKAFLASIRDLGVLVPVVAVRQPDGALRVRYGHRRTIAAVQTGRDTIPVYIRDDTTSDDADAAGQAARIVEQLTENVHRTGLTTGEHVHAVQQLALLGVSPAQIARRTHTRRTHVDAALALTSDDDVARACATSLTVAAWCAEVADDPHAVEVIEWAYAQDGETGAKHAVARIRQERAYAAAVDAALAHLADTQPELVVWTERPTWGSPATEVDDLENVDPATHSACPQHAVLLVEADPDEPGMVDLTIDGVAFTLQPWCADWHAAGHAHRWHRTTPTGSASTGDGADGDGGREAARAERRRVLAGNRAWDAACEVRREWVETLLARKVLPKDAIIAVARTATCATLRFDHAATPSLGTNPDATRALLRLALTTLEDATMRGDWRTPERPSSTTATLLTSLAGWGYVLAPVEVATSGGEPFTLAEGTE